jgi:hypothetical protein
VVSVRKRGTLQSESPQCRVSEFKPDERERVLIEKALRGHREVQAREGYEQRRLIGKWSRETGVTPRSRTAVRARAWAWKTRMLKGGCRVLIPCKKNDGTSSPVSGKDSGPLETRLDEYEHTRST